MFVKYHDELYKVEGFVHKAGGVIMVTLSGLGFDVNIEFVDIVA